MKRAAILLMTIMLAMGSAIAAPPRGGGHGGNGGGAPPPGRYNQGGQGQGPGPGYNQGGRQPYEQPRRQEADPGSRRMSPEERDRLRRDIRDHGGQIYRDRRN